MHLVYRYVYKVQVYIVQYVESKKDIKLAVQTGQLDLFW